jgi:hypothetical protein
MFTGNYRAVRLTGRCANGAERDGGTKYHALAEREHVALCGAKPGRRSVGWSDYADSVRDVSKTTCPRCIAKFKREAERLGAIGLIDRADDLRLALRANRS